MCFVIIDKLQPSVLEIDAGEGDTEFSFDACLYLFTMSMHDLNK